MDLKITRFFVVWLMLFALPRSYAQLADFTLSVTSTNETCTGNGTLSFNVSGTTTGSSVVYNIYKLPNLSIPIATTSQGTFSGLTSGTYQVTATQTLGALSNSQSVLAEIEDQVSVLAYQINGQKEVCGDDGVITVIPISGSAAFFEITSGPETFPQQTSGTFSGLAAGVYVVRVTDVCGDAVVQTYTLLSQTPGINLGVEPTSTVDCDSLEIGLTITPAENAAAAYPMTITCTVFPPNGDPVVFTQTINNPGAGNPFNYTETIPNYDGAIFSYQIVVTDNCGNIYESESIIEPTLSEPGYSILSEECVGDGLLIFNITGLILDSAPGAYSGAVPFDFTSDIGPDHIYQFGQLPVGTYNFSVLDLCGNPSQLEIEILPTIGSTPSVGVFGACDPGLGSLIVGGNLEQVIMTGAPPAFSQAVPIDVSANITSQGVMVMANLPMGIYSFHTVDSCGFESDVTASVQGYSQETDINLIRHCGTFDLELIHTSSGGISQEFWLQEFNPSTGGWGHPATGFPYTENTQANETNSIELNVNGVTYNLPFSGTFRILKIYQSLENGSLSFVHCYEVVFNFTYDDGPAIEDVYSFSCSNSLSDVVVQAEGVAPLFYSITQFNGNPFVINNETSNVFTGLAMGIYNFEVHDSCGNIVNSLFEINSSLDLAITPTPFCEGQDAVLSVPDFDFLEYQWWLGSDTSNVLSTSASLDFDQFNSSLHNGIYSVRIKNPDPLSCIDVTLTINVSGTAAPISGSGLTAAFCDRPQLDLFTMLGQPFDPGGSWQEVETSGTLSQNIADLSGLAAGTYHFVYTVSNTCGSVSSTVTLILNPSVGQPIASAENENCAGTELLLFASGDANSYSWTGPNNFSSSEQNPVITNAGIEFSGTYTVISTLGDCVSQPASVEVMIGQQPDIAISAECQADVRILTATLSASVQDVQYQWSGPEGFSSSSSQAVITGNPPGNYSVSVTTPEGCVAFATLSVSNTLCVIPLGISPNGDGLNDDLDLSGFDVDNIQIFNRYGVTVFESASYTDGWHGQDFNGRILPAGSYYFLVRLNSGEHESGWVYLNREH